jgi:hypothetical protein
VYAPQGPDVGNAIAATEVECVYSPQGPDVGNAMTVAEVECVYTPQGAYLGDATAVAEVECKYTPKADTSTISRQPLRSTWRTDRNRRGFCIKY